MAKYRCLLASALLVSITSVSALAEIYKWKDKDGVTRYTDTPPPNGTKDYQTLGNKASKPPQTPSPEAAEAQSITKDMQRVSPKSEEASAEALAEKRRQLAETEKRNKAEKEAEQKRRVLNCNAAKANLQAYSQGGRIYKTNSQGERVYLGDEDLEVGMNQAQREINENCN